MGTERDAARRFRNRYPDTRFEPLPILVDKRDERDRRPADLRCEQYDIVEGPLGLGVENAMVVQCHQTSGLARVHLTLATLDGAHTAPATEVRRSRKTSTTRSTSSSVLKTDIDSRKRLSLAMMVPVTLAPWSSLAAAVASLSPNARI